MKRAKWADRGHALQLKSSQGQWAQCVGASRLGSVEMTRNELSIWMQMRGSSWVEAREGRFYLRTGDWIAFGKDSMPVIQANKGGICIGLAISDEAIRSMARFSDFSVHAGHGRLRPGDIRSTARLWYRAAGHMAANATTDRIPAPLRSLLLQLEGFQRDYPPRIQLCPGASQARKRQVFERMQRAHLYLEGHCDRIVRISELAVRTGFSPWYFSKVFHKLYGESPQSASAHMRLDHAANLLASTSMAIGEVGVASGFDNNCSFARSFRARYGMTASDYRNASLGIGQASQTRATTRANHTDGRRESFRSKRKTGSAISSLRFVGA